MCFETSAEKKLITLTAQTKVEQVNTLIDWEPEEERKLVRKLDRRVLLPCCIVYFLAYLDRANMVSWRHNLVTALIRLNEYQGFAGVLQADTPDSFVESLGLKGLQFNWAISITYFMVTILLIPSNLLMKTVSGKRYFPCIMICFGTIVCSIAAVKGAAGLLAARFFLGVPESGVVSRQFSDGASQPS